MLVNAVQLLRERTRRRVRVSSCVPRFRAGNWAAGKPTVLM
jgi:hypothetical protein